MMQRRRFLAHAVTGFVSLAPLMRGQAASKDPWPETDLMKPEELAKKLASSAAKSPVVFVGFPVLYRAAHIPGALLAGPCSKPEVLAKLRETAADWPPNREIVIYCGCCPFDHCPNVRPAYNALHQMGFTRVMVLDIPDNFHADWAAKGYPTEKSVS